MHCPQAPHQAPLCSGSGSCFLRQSRSVSAGPSVHDSKHFPSQTSTVGSRSSVQGGVWRSSDKGAYRNTLYQRTRMISGQNSALRPGGWFFLVLTVSDVAVAAPPEFHQLPKTQTLFAFLDPLLSLNLDCSLLQLLQIISSWLRTPRPIWTIDPQISEMN